MFPSAISNRPAKVSIKADVFLSNYTYLLLDLGSISIPFICSFDHRLKFFSQWKCWLPAIFLTGLFFIVWDVLFTYWKIWGFNPDYLTGINIINLPLEEWLFFFCIPYACLFTYEALGYLIRKHWFNQWQNQITLVLIISLFVIGMVNLDKAYTSTTFLLLAIMLLLHLLWFKSAYMGQFYLSFVFILIPFFLVARLAGISATIIISITSKSGRKYFFICCHPYL